MTLLNYASNYFNRVRIVYRHASLQHSFNIRLSETNYTNLKAGTFDGFTQLSAFLQSIVTTYGYDDFAFLSLSTCDVGKAEYVERDIPPSLEVNPGVLVASTSHSIHKAGYARIEGSSSTEDGVCKGHLTLNGLLLANTFSNDFRWLPSEVPTIISALDSLNIWGGLYGANGVSLRFKRYINTGISRSLQKRFRG